MKYMTVIYLFGIAIYNLIGNNDHLYWRFHYFFLSACILAFAFWELRQKSIIGSRKIYFTGFIFSCFYGIFELFALTKGNVAKYIGIVNSVVWGIISALLVLTLLIIFCYDKNSKRKAA